MQLNKEINKTQIVITLSYLLLFSLAIVTIYLIIVKYQTASTINSKKVQIHTTQLDLQQFNKIYQQIQEQSK